MLFIFIFLVGVRFRVNSRKLPECAALGVNGFVVSPDSRLAIFSEPSDSGRNSPDPTERG